MLLFRALAKNMAPMTNADESPYAFLTEHFSLSIYSLTRCSKSVEFIKLQQVCENQTCCNLIFVDLLQVAETSCIKRVDKSLDNQLAPSLLTTCSKLRTIKPEQAMRTHPDIGLMTARQQSYSRLAATCAFLAVIYTSITLLTS